MPSRKPACGGRTHRCAPTMRLYPFLAFCGGRLSHGGGEMSAKQTERDGPRKGKVALRTMTDEVFTVTKDRK